MADDAGTGVGLQPAVESTLVISDLHLGRQGRADVLQRTLPRERLTERLRTVDRLVILGDFLELREGPARDALRRAEPVLRDLGAAMSGREIVVVCGNHDHELAVRWHAARYDGDGVALGLAHAIEPEHASELALAVANALQPAKMTVSYPGVWLRDDVYATHGHYLDAHSAIPTFERLAAGVTARIAGAVPLQASPEDYERVLVPNYSWSAAVAARSAPAHAGTGAASGVRAYQVLVGDGKRRLRHRALARLFPLAVAGLRRAGLQPLQADISPPAMRRALLTAMAEVVQRLGVEAEHVVFGHTHRPGPLPGDENQLWHANGAILHNAGSWIFEEHFAHGPNGPTPFWPGRAIAVERHGPPRLENLLGDLPASALRPQ